MTQNGGAKEAGICIRCVANAAIGPRNDDQSAGAGTGQRGDGDLDVVALLRGQVQISTTGIVENVDGKCRSRTASIHLGCAAKDVQRVIRTIRNERRAAGRLSEEGRTAIDVGRRACVGSVEDGRSQSGNGQDAAAGRRTIDSVSLASCDSDGAGADHGDHTVGGDVVRHQELTTIEGDAAGRNRGVAKDGCVRIAEIGIGADADDASIDENRASDCRCHRSKGVGATEHKGSESVLGNAATDIDHRVDIGRSTDHSCLCERHALADIEDTVAREREIIADGEGGIPSTESAAAEDDGGSRRERRCRTEQQGAGDQGGGTRVAVGTVVQLQDAAAGEGKADTRAADDTIEIDPAGGAAHIEHAVGGTCEVHGAVQDQVSSTTHEGVCKEGTRGAAGELDVVCQRAWREEQRQAGGVRLQGAVVEGDGSRADRGVVADLEGHTAIERGAAVQRGVGSIDRHGAGVVDHRDARSRVGRADDQ